MPPKPLVPRLDFASTPLVKRREGGMLTYRDGDREMEVEMTDRQDSNFLVAVRIRPLNTKESENLEAHPVVTRAVGDALISFDPPTQAPKGLHVRGNHRHADVRFAFDVVFDHDCSQDQVYDRCARPLIKSVLNGINATIFAYGATGSGAFALARSHSRIITPHTLLFSRFVPPHGAASARRAHISLLQAKHTRWSATAAKKAS